MMTERHILIVDDSEAIRAHVQGVLDDCHQHYQTLVAKDGLEGFKILVSRPVDLVLCDVVMPVLDGFKLLNLKRTRPELQDVPVIMLTGAEDITQKVRALESGAQDYLTKPFHDAELVARVAVHLQVRALQRELRAKNQQLEVLSNTDGLTKLTNRRHLMELAQIELLRAEQEQHSLAWVMADIDHFKSVNDEHGHVMGDRALQAVAEVLRGDLRESDVAARYGGEEFALLLPATNLTGARAVAERYRSRIESLVIQERGRHQPLRVSQHGFSLPAPVAGPDDPLLDSQQLSRDSRTSNAPSKTLRVTSSFGVAVFPSGKIHTVDELIQAADRALYCAKQAGRNRVCVADEPANVSYSLSDRKSSVGS